MVEEELPIGSRIGDVEALDEDEGDNAVIDYAIIGEYNPPGAWAMPGAGAGLVWQPGRSVPTDIQT